MAQRSTAGKPPYGQDKLPEMRVITDAKELKKYTYIKVRNIKVFPKKDRLLAAQMLKEATDLVTDLKSANDHLLADPLERRQRFMDQRSALRNARNLADDIELAHDILDGVTEDVFAYWAQLVSTVIGRTAAWYKKDRDRASRISPVTR